MPPIKRKRCCVPYCKNIQEISNKQFFKLGANLEHSSKWFSIAEKTISPKSHILYCCEDHFDLPNDAENFIRHKYIPGTKLKLRTNVLPKKKLPVDVCRLCLKLIYNEESVVEISECNANIVAATLPEIDLNMTVEPVSCAKCFECIQQYYNIKSTVLKSEITVANYMKSKVKSSPSRMIKNCQMDLFEEYNDIIEAQIKDNGNDQEIPLIQGKAEHVLPSNHSDIIYQINDTKKKVEQGFAVEVYPSNFDIAKHQNDTKIRNVKYADEESILIHVEGISNDKIPLKSHQMA